MIRHLTAAALALLHCASWAAACDWSHPGDNRFTGDIARAIARYADIPEQARAELVTKAKARAPDDVVEITRGGITGRHGAYTGLRAMYFGPGKLCETVTRDDWPQGQIERGWIYRSGPHAVLVPWVCGNVSRVDWRPDGAGGQSSAPAGDASIGGPGGGRSGDAVGAGLRTRAAGQGAGIVIAPDGRARSLGLGSSMPEPSSWWLVVAAFLGCLLVAIRNGRK